MHRGALPPRLPIYPAVSSRVISRHLDLLSAVSQAGCFQPPHLTNNSRLSDPICHPICYLPHHASPGHKRRFSLWLCLVFQVPTRPTGSLDYRKAVLLPACRGWMESPSVVGHLWLPLPHNYLEAHRAGAVSTCSCPLSSATGRLAIRYCMVCFTRVLPC